MKSKSIAVILSTLIVSSSLCHTNAKALNSNAKSLIKGAVAGPVCVVGGLALSCGIVATVAGMVSVGAWVADIPENHRRKISSRWHEQEESFNKIRDIILKSNNEPIYYYERNKISDNLAFHLNRIVSSNSYVESNLNCIRKHCAPYLIEQVSIKAEMAKEDKNCNSERAGVRKAIAKIENDCLRSFNSLQVEIFKSLVAKLAPNKMYSNACIHLLLDILIYRVEGGAIL